MQKLTKNKNLENIRGGKKNRERGVKMGSVENGQIWTARNMGKLQDEKNPERTSIILFKKSPGRGNLKIAKTENCESASTEIQPHEDGTIVLINEPIHVANMSLAASNFGAARACGLGYGVRIKNEGVQPTQQREGMLPGIAPCLSGLLLLGNLMPPHARNATACPLPNPAA